MPYKSDAQRRYFNANRKKLEAQGVDVDHWNEVSKGKKLPEKASSVQALAKQAAEATPEYKPPSPLSAFLTGLGVVGTQAGQQAGSKLYADAMIGKPNPAFSRYPGLRMDETWDQFKESLQFPFKKANPLYKRIPKDKIKLYDRIFEEYGKDAPFFTERTGRGPAAYSAKPHTVLVNLGIKDRHGGVLAHELGHAQQRKFLNSPLGRASIILPALGQLLGLGSSAMVGDEDTGRNLALASSASTLPMLGYEFDASRRGSKLLRDTLKRSGEWAKLGLGEKAIKRLAPFVGLPTYMNLAATPLLLHGVKKYLGGYGSYAKAPTFSEKIKTLVGKFK